MVDRKSLCERDICTKYITPAITPPGCCHSHHNDSDQDAIVLPIQDAGLVMNMQALDFKLAKKA